MLAFSEDELGIRRLLSVTEEYARAQILSDASVVVAVATLLGDVAAWSLHEDEVFGRHGTSGHNTACNSAFSWSAGERFLAGTLPHPGPQHVTC